MQDRCITHRTSECLLEKLCSKSTRPFPINDTLLPAIYLLHARCLVLILPARYLLDARCLLRILPARCLLDARCLVLILTARCLLDDTACYLPAR